ncbi:DUF1285 domain-containing protein [Ferrimonas gelatinilytica]|uniref:DUF1285 domain-containing protein n=1 Tax=Ferrimonas gelatinilytica TaxID=1255257 RepID=A0ABP9RVM7_9GAMM
MLERLTTQVGEHPKLALWDPPLCGDIDIEIDREGVWHSQGSPITRERLVRLLASVLRREADGHYYLVTPVEKWRIRVQDKPFLLTELRYGKDPESAAEVPETDLATVQQDDSGGRRWWLMGPLGVALPVGPSHPWTLAGELPCILLWHGNQGRLGRNLYYRLAQQASLRNGEYGVELNGQWCPLGRA